MEHAAVAVPPAQAVEQGGGGAHLALLVEMRAELLALVRGNASKRVGGGARLSAADVAALRGLDADLKSLLASFVSTGFLQLSRAGF